MALLQRTAGSYHDNEDMMETSSELGHGESYDIDIDLELTHTQYEQEMVNEMDERDGSAVVPPDNDAQLALENEIADAPMDDEATIVEPVIPVPVHDEPVQDAVNDEETDDEDLLDEIDEVEPVMADVIHGESKDDDLNTFLAHSNDRVISAHLSSSSPKASPGPSEIPQGENHQSAFFDQQGIESEIEEPAKSNLDFKSDRSADTNSTSQQHAEIEKANSLATNAAAFDQYTTSDAANRDHVPPTLDIQHPVLVIFRGEEVPLFSSGTSYENDFPTYFLEDVELAYSRVSFLISAFRDVVQESIEDDEELELAIEDLGFKFSESNSGALSVSLSQILETFLDLHKNDGNEEPPPLSLHLNAIKTCAYHWTCIANFASEGRGVSEVWNLQDRGLRGKEEDELEETNIQEAFTGADQIEDGSKLFAAEVTIRRNENHQSESEHDSASNSSKLLNDETSNDVPSSLSEHMADDGGEKSSKANINTSRQPDSKPSQSPQPLLSKPYDIDTKSPDLPLIGLSSPKNNNVTDSLQTREGETIEIGNSQSPKSRAIHKQSYLELGADLDDRNSQTAVDPPTSGSEDERSMKRAEPDSNGLAEMKELSPSSVNENEAAAPVTLTTSPNDTKGSHPYDQRGNSNLAAGYNENHSDDTDHEGRGPVQDGDLSQYRRLSVPGGQSTEEAILESGQTVGDQAQEASLDTNTQSLESPGDVYVDPNAVQGVSPTHDHDDLLISDDWAATDLTDNLVDFAPSRRHSESIGSQDLTADVREGLDANSTPLPLKRRHDSTSGEYGSSVNSQSTKRAKPSDPNQKNLLHE